MPSPTRRVMSVLLLAATAATPARADTTPDSDMRLLWSRRLAQLAKAAEPGEVEDLVAKMGADGTYPDLDYASTLRNDSWGPKFQLERMATLVGAYLADGPHKGDPKVKAAVLRGVESWLSHDYLNSNWWWNKIGTPNRLVPSLFAFWDDLSAEQKAAAIRILARSKMETQLESVGTNLVWFNLVALDRGLLTNDPAVVGKAISDIAGDIRLAPKQRDGAQPDNSYLFHGSLNYTLGYGLDYLRDQAHLAAMCAGTRFAFPKDRMALIRDWTLDGAQWMARGRSGDFAAIGRTIARKGQQDMKRFTDVGRDLLAVDAGRAGEVRDMIARVTGQADARPLVGNRQFWRADMMVHHRPGWYASARLFSTRTRNTECGNGENLRGFYLADGMNLLMRSGQEYADFPPFWNWQHLPGTTVELLPDFGPVAGKPNGANDSFNPKINTIQRGTKETFVGGVSDGMYGIFGGKFSRDALTVRRGWFFFDDQYVCLGSGLTCTSGNPVVTTLDDRKLNGPVTVAGDAGATTYGADPADPNAADDHGVASARWMLHDGVGYAFLTPAAVKFHSGPRTGDWHEISTAYPKKPERRDVFDAWIEHAAPVNGASYAYVVYPQTDQKALAAASAASPVTVASNTPDCQAVWHEKLGRGGAIFYAAGDVKLRDGLMLGVDQSCMALVTTAGGVVQVTISNPENKPGTVKVSLTHRGNTTKFDVKLPDGGQAGSSVTRTP